MTTCHGGAGLYADPKLATVLTDADREAIFGRVAVRELKRCDLFAATNIALDSVLATTRGDRSALLGRINWPALALLLVLVAAGVLVASLVGGHLVLLSQRAHARLTGKAASIPPVDGVGEDDQTDETDRIDRHPPA